MWKKVGVVYTLIHKSRVNDALECGIAGGSHFFSTKDKALKYKHLDVVLVEANVYEFEIKDFIPKHDPAPLPNLEKRVCTLAQDLAIIPWD